MKQIENIPMTVFFLNEIKKRENYPGDWVRLSNAELVKAMKRSERTVQRTRRKLEESGLIEVRMEEHDGSKRTSRLVRIA